jgi:hypothetical protein
MASKKHRPEEALAKLRQVDVLVSQGQSVAEAIRAIGVTEVTYYTKSHCLEPIRRSTFPPICRAPSPRMGSDQRDLV